MLRDFPYTCVCECECKSLRDHLYQKYPLRLTSTLKNIVSRKKGPCKKWASLIFDLVHASFSSEVIRFLTQYSTANNRAVRLDNRIQWWAMKWSVGLLRSRLDIGLIKRLLQLNICTLNMHMLLSKKTMMLVLHHSVSMTLNNYTLYQSLPIWIF